MEPASWRKKGFLALPLAGLYLHREISKNFSILRLCRITASEALTTPLGRSRLQASGPSADAPQRLLGRPAPATNLFEKHLEHTRRWGSFREANPGSKRMKDHRSRGDFPEPDFGGVWEIPHVQ